MLQASVSYTDPHGRGKTASAQTTDAVANDPPAFTTAGPAGIAVDENAAIGASVGEALAAADPNGDEISFNLTGTGADDFSVDGNGQVSTATRLDHETAAAYSLTAHATDPAGSADTLELNISVRNVEEAGSVTISPTGQPEVNSALSATLTDPDGSISGTSWQWHTASTAAGPWTPIPAAASGSYTPGENDVDQYLKVTASYRDGHGSGADAAEAITAGAVAPEPNRPPTFDAATTTFNISVNVVEGVRVSPPFRVTDPNGDTLAYSLTSDTADAFTVNAETGEVLMGSMILEEGTTHTATISVTDGLDIDHNADDSTDDSLSLSMTMVNPNIHVDPSHHHTYPSGLWRNEDLILVANQDATNPMVLVYDAQTGGEIENRSFELTTAHAKPKGVWSDGTTVYVTDDRQGARKDWVRAYRLSNGSRQGGRDIGLDNQQHNVTGIWSDGTTLYVVNRTDRKLYAYILSDGSRDSSKDVTLDSGNLIITDFWSDGATVWVAGWRHEFIRAFSMTTGESLPDLDVQLAESNRGPSGLHSDGFNLWALDQVNDTIYGYVVPR